MAKTKTTSNVQRLSPTPMMRPGRYTVDQVIDFVTRVIDREPKRLKMNNWVTYFKGRLLRPTRITKASQPACGTVACVGGWIGIAVTGREVSGAYPILQLLGLVEWTEPKYGIARLDYTPAFANEAAELEAIFMRVKSKKTVVVKLLRDYVGRHRPTLKKLTVTVPNERVSSWGV
jgi:hypothetical protein